MLVGACPKSVFGFGTEHARDNSTRGLDASTALDYTNSLRIMTDVSNRTTLVTLYQAGEGIYELMDKVLVVDGGRMVYQGPANEAKQYMTDLGFHCPDRETTADFLAAVTDPKQRVVREGYEARVPRSAEDFERAFRNSEAYRRVLADLEDYETHLDHTDYQDAKDFKQSVGEQKSKRVSSKSSFTVSFWRQVLVSLDVSPAAVFQAHKYPGLHTARILAGLG